MTQENERKLAEVFRAVLSLGPDSDVSGVRQLSTPGWDSLAHVSLVAAIESEFGVSIDIADSMALTSFRAATLYLKEQGR
jgi:acyl carrier protein